MTKLNDFFPSRQMQTYEYEAFEMVLPHRPQDGLVNVLEDSPLFQRRFSESYTFSDMSLTAQSLRSGVDIVTNYHVVPAGLFALDSPTDKDHCTIPLPLQQGAFFVSLYGKTKIVSFSDDELWVLETLEGDAEGYVKTLYRPRAWIVQQEVDTKMMRYVLKQHIPPNTLSASSN